MDICNFRRAACALPVFKSLARVSRRPLSFNPNKLLPRTLISIRINQNLKDLPVCPSPG